MSMVFYSVADKLMSKFIFTMRNTLLRKHASSPTRAFSTLSVIRKNNPEPQSRYEPGGYHPVIAGEVYNQRYQAIRKLGWGLYSVVWLVQDTQDKRLAAMKILVGDMTIPNNKGGWDELDIKGDNILMTGAPPEEGPLELDDDYLMSSTFKISDFGAANIMSNRFAEVIQPESLRSPEVIIGAEWDTKTDIWNFGCLVYEFARGSKLFDPYWDNEKSGMNPTQTHLSQIVGLCGDFPPELLERGRKSKPYFDLQGSLLKSAGRYSITLEDLLSRASHTPEEVSEAAHFLSLMLVVNPKERWSAAQLLDHSWLKNVDYVSRSM
ncbi:hypothetical protein GALMADRAFT_135591 [Galerina marginata CBS 339.88]|uniref:non-specific serine/threonine protein kinase n=1 Tax=Galerina marginata (strain CBS 339.88) TaxID=685588 RepID=A0A067TIQ2_GALM3|nr:hypothetical protein GALMADRAFT_135591 [Galerina marginata CBS 339.88]